MTARSPWGVAVRDDGLAYFTELNNGGVGITSTRTRTGGRLHPDRGLPDRDCVLARCGTAYVTKQGSANVGVIDFATATAAG